VPPNEWGNVRADLWAESMAELRSRWGEVRSARTAKTKAKAEHFTENTEKSGGDGDACAYWGNLLASTSMAGVGGPPGIDGKKGTARIGPCFFVELSCAGYCAGAAGAPILEPMISPEMMISTRRFCWRPSAVSLLATGLAFPKPVAVIDDGSRPCWTR
jgi:hypothetical protein